MNKIAKLSAALVALGLVSMTQAATPGGYVGGGLGYSMIHTPKQIFNTTGDETGTLSSSNSRGGLGGRVFAGYNFSKFFGLEMGYTQFAKSTYSVSAVDEFSGKIDYNDTAFDIVGKGYLPIQNSGFNVFALGGIAHVFQKVTADFTQYGQNEKASASTDKVRPVFGLGASYDINNHLTTSLEYRRIVGSGNVDTNIDAIPDADLVTLNLAYNFG